MFPYCLYLQTPNAQFMQIYPKKLPIKVILEMRLKLN